ncbi:MAG: outer membrane protein assembly factor BamE [Comamonas sp.]
MPVQVTSSVRLALMLALGASVAACGTFNDASRKFASAITPYKVEVVQGNVVTKQQVEALQQGMSRQQVKDVLGTPLLTSVFHADRWDYVFTIKRPGVAEQTRKFSVFFKEDALDRFEGDEMPSEEEFVASLTTAIKNPKVPVLEATPEQLAKHSSKPAAEGDAEAADAAKPDAPTGVRPSSYPPLETPAR